MFAALAALLLPVIASAGPVDFTFSSNGTFNWALFGSTYLNVGPGGGGGSTLDFDIGSRQTLPISRHGYSSTTACTAASTVN